MSFRWLPEDEGYFEEVETGRRFIFEMDRSQTVRWMVAQDTRERWLIDQDMDERWWLVPETYLLPWTRWSNAYLGLTSDVPSYAVPADEGLIRMTRAHRILWD